MAKLNQTGSSHIVALVGVLVIAAVGFAGYRVLNNNSTLASNNTTPVAQTTKIPSKVSSTTDLKKADAALNSTAIDGSVNPNDLNNDLSAL